MLPSHFLRYDNDSHRVALLREAERARQARLVRAETPSLWQRWFARSRRGSLRLSWHQATLPMQAKAVAPQSILASSLPAACCRACSC